MCLSRVVDRSRPSKINKDALIYLFPRALIAYSENTPEKANINAMRLEWEPSLQSIESDCAVRLLMYRGKVYRRCDPAVLARWRRGWDSNPRWTCAHAGFQDRCLKPLGHPSETVPRGASGRPSSRFVRIAPPSRFVRQSQAQAP
jgi:hypothetical protein